MLPKLVFAMLVMTVASGLLAVDEFNAAVITKVDGNKVTFYTIAKGGQKRDEITLPVAENATIATARFNKEEKKIEAGDPLKGGLKNDAFKNKKGTRARITTDHDNKKITEILTFRTS
ncbi:MAG: hypothetical protein EXR98_13095 [Gemmataceae bacterium]|nr:hypothetical protein [Gemmataceae bacterium]